MAQFVKPGAKVKRATAPVGAGTAAPTSSSNSALASSSSFAPAVGGAGAPSARASSAGASSRPRSSSTGPAAAAMAPGASSSSSSGAGATSGLGAASPDTPRKLVVVLEQASLESVKTKKGFELLNCDDHVGLHKKSGRDPASSRPDITHQLLLALMDSPLNKAGHLQVYVQTVSNVLIEISPHTRIPRTFKRFCGLMVQLLHKMRVRAADSSEMLMKVIKNPVTTHLPVGAVVVGLEAGAKLVDAMDLPALLPSGRPIVFVIGAMSHGDIASDFIEQTYSISRYPLSAACAVGKLLSAFERAWDVL